MSIPWNAIAEPAPAAPLSVGADRVIVRRFDPAIDSYAQLTPMLHRAFARLGAMGLNCTCVDQDEDVTRHRAEAGECYVAVCGGRVVGTATLYATDPSSACSLYRREGVASVRQLAVDPACQSRGIGALLLSFAEQWAASRGYALLALDTPHPAAHLLAFYGAQGFEVVDVMRFAGKRYDSAILCKRPVARPVRRVSSASRLAARVAAVRRVLHAWAPRIVVLARREAVCVAPDVSRRAARPMRPVAGRRRGGRVSTAVSWPDSGGRTPVRAVRPSRGLHARTGRGPLDQSAQSRVPMARRTNRLDERRAGRHATACVCHSSRPRASPPPFARRHAIVPSMPTATTSAPHST